MSSTPIPDESSSQNRGKDKSENKDSRGKDGKDIRGKDAKGKDVKGKDAKTMPLHLRRNMGTSASGGNIDTNPNPNIHPTKPQPEENSEVEGEEEEIIPRPRPQTFNPFFVLINNAKTKSTFHPREVHYLFEDDERDGLVGALSRCAAASASGLSGEREREKGGRGEERVIVLDMDVLDNRNGNGNGDGDGDGDGDEGGKEGEVELGVDRVVCLSPNWQVLSASLDMAPSLEGGGEGGGSGSAGMMVRVEGVEVDAGGEEDVGDGDVDLAAVEEFEGGMEVLRRVISMGMQKRRGDSDGQQEGDEDGGKDAGNAGSRKDADVDVLIGKGKENENENVNVKEDVGVGDEVGGG